MTPEQLAERRRVLVRGYRRRAHEVSTDTEAKGPAPESQGQPLVVYDGEEFEQSHRQWMLESIDVPSFRVTLRSACFFG